MQCLVTINYDQYLVEASIAEVETLVKLLSSMEHVSKEYDDGYHYQMKAPKRMKVTVSTEIPPLPVKPYEPPAAPSPKVEATVYADDSMRF